MSDARRFWLKYFALWVICTACIAAFMMSPYWLNGWEVPFGLYVGSPIVGLLCASLVMVGMEVFL